jgi:hypothetical protein
MEAIEFVAKVKNGKVIEIPLEHLRELSGEFRVIILLENQEKKKRVQKNQFKALSLKTKGVKIDRDEIYDE